MRVSAYKKRDRQRKIVRGIIIKHDIELYKIRDVIWVIIVLFENALANYNDTGYLGFHDIAIS